jgi:erythromycin esterase-like protein
MDHPPSLTTYTTPEEWISSEALSFSLDDPATFNTAVDKVMALLGHQLELLGLGEALHGGEQILILRNRLFQYLVETHGYSAIAVESSFPRSQLVNDYLAGRGPAVYHELEDRGFSHGFGRLEANRELVEWMGHYNADPAHRVKLRFYGFDSPTEMMSSDSPRQVLHFVLDYLASVAGGSDLPYRQRIDQLLGVDAAWENPAAMLDPAQSVGGSPNATALRLETEELISELHLRRPELLAKSEEERYWEALHYATMARQLLHYHASVAKAASDRVSKLLGMRDALMADNLSYIMRRERSRGKVLVFAHNTHLKRGEAQWQLGGELQSWWPAGAQLDALFGPRYAVIGSAVGQSPDNGIDKPETGTLENVLTTIPGPVRFLPTHRGQGLPASLVAALPTRSGSTRNSTYFPLTSQSLTDFDWLVMLDSTTYSRGGPILP